MKHPTRSLAALMIPRVPRLNAASLGSHGGAE